MMIIDMPLVRVKASASISAPPEVVYDLIADYQGGHQSILPPEYFEDLVALEGERGAGTRIRYTMRAFGYKETSHARVSEPEPGRVLVETVEERPIVTTFIVEPEPNGCTTVTFLTEYRTRGLRGCVEAMVLPRYLRKVYAAELQLLARRATGAAQEQAGATRGMLEESACWKVSGVRSAQEFFRAVPLLVPEATHMFLEGSPAPEIKALLADAADEARYAAPAGTLWSWPQKEGRFSVRPSPELFAQLAAAAAHHAEPEICSHLHFYRREEPLVQWFDAFADPLLVSKAVARDRVERFASSAGGVLSDGAS